MTIKIASRVLLSMLAATVFLSSGSQLLFSQQIEGQYRISNHALKPPPAPRSLDQVKVVEALSISCIHCYNFFASSEKKFLDQFGDKVDFSFIDVGWIGPNLSRFLYLADNYQATHDTIEILFRSFHDDGIRSLNSPKMLKTIAAELDFPADYEEAMQDKAITRKLIEGSTLLNRFKITTTPSFIIEDSIVVVGNDVNNLSRVVNSLLKEPVSL